MCKKFHPLQHVLQIYYFLNVWCHLKMYAGICDFSNYFRPGVSKIRHVVKSSPPLLFVKQTNKQTFFGNTTCPFHCLLSTTAFVLQSYKGRGEEGGGDHVGHRAWKIYYLTLHRKRLSGMTRAFPPPSSNGSLGLYSVLAAILPGNLQLTFQFQINQKN